MKRLIKNKKLAVMVVLAAVLLVILELTYATSDHKDIPTNDHITASGAE